MKSKRKYDFNKGLFAATVSVTLFDLISRLTEIVFLKFIFQVNSWEELEVISALSKDQTSGNDNLKIVPTTKVSFVGRQYRFVFCLDITPSLATVVIIIFNFLDPWL